MSAKSEEAVERFKKGFNCSQAVFGTFSEQVGLDCETACKVATGFGGGMRMGGTCGAVTGAFMALGLKYGNNGKLYVEAARNPEQRRVGLTSCFPNRLTSSLGILLCGC